MITHWNSLVLMVLIQCMDLSKSWRHVVILLLLLVSRVKPYLVYLLPRKPKDLNSEALDVARTPNQRKPVIDAVPHLWDYKKAEKYLQGILRRSNHGDVALRERADVVLRQLKGEASHEERTYVADSDSDEALKSSMSPSMWWSNSPTSADTSIWSRTRRVAGPTEVELSNWP